MKKKRKTKKWIHHPTLIRKVSLFLLFILVINLPLLLSVTRKTQQVTQHAAGGQTFSITVCPHGLGNCGDNVTPGNGGNTTPQHTQRTIALSFLNNAGQSVASGQGTISYVQSAQNFQGLIQTTTVTNGQYLVQITVRGFLTTQVPGIITVTQGQVITLPSVSLVTGDINDDDQVDILDYNLLISCFGSKQTTASCTNPPTTQSPGADITDDGKVDGTDYNQFIRELSVQKSGNPSMTPTITAPPPPTVTVTPPSNTSSKLFGVNIAGADFQTPQYAGTGYSGYSYYHGKGLTLVRLPFTWEKMEPTLGGALGGDINKLTDMITAAQSAGEMIFIEPHNYARYNGTPLTTADASSFANFWQQLSAKYATGYPGLWGYELMNEPHDLSGGCQTWETLAQAAVTAIRQSDTTHYILIPGYQWQSAMGWQSASSCLSAVHDPANKMYFSAHQYFDSDASGTHSTPCPDPQVGVQRLQPFFSWLSQNNAKGLLTEYGAAADSCWLTALDNFMNALTTNPNIVGATYWAGGPFWGSYFMSVEPSNGQDKPQMSILQKYPSH